MSDKKILEFCDRHPRVVLAGGLLLFLLMSLNME